MISRRPITRITSRVVGRRGPRLSFVAIRSDVREVSRYQHLIEMNELRNPTGIEAAAPFGVDVKRQSSLRVLKGSLNRAVGGRIIRRRIKKMPFEV